MGKKARIRDLEDRLGWAFNRLSASEGMIRELRDRVLDIEDRDPRGAADAIRGATRAMELDAEWERSQDASVPSDIEHGAGFDSTPAFSPPPRSW